MERKDLPEYGMDRDVSQKLKVKYDIERENQARKWIETILKHSLPEDRLQVVLKDGTVLCELMNVLFPQSCKLNQGKMPFQHMENIQRFLNMAEKQLGVPKTDLFQTVELYEDRDMGQVLNGLFAVARHAHAHNKETPLLGPKLNEKHSIKFSEDVLNQGKVVISPQMGSAGGANQSGMCYGTFRQIDAKAGKASEVPVAHVSGFNKGDNQRGLSYGAFRQIVSKTDPGTTTPVIHTSGYTKGANQRGIVYGLPRQIGGLDPKKALVEQNSQ